MVVVVVVVVVVMVVVYSGNGSDSDSGSGSGNGSPIKKAISIFYLCPSSKFISKEESLKIVGLEARVEGSSVPVIVPCPWCSDSECRNLKQFSLNCLICLNQ